MSWRRSSVVFSIVVWPKPNNLVVNLQILGECRYDFLSFVSCVASGQKGRTDPTDLRTGENMHCNYFFLSFPSYQVSPLPNRRIILSGCPPASSYCLGACCLEINSDTCRKELRLGQALALHRSLGLVRSLESLWSLWSTGALIGPNVPKGQSAKLGR